MTTKKIYFVRHGETDSNVQRYVPSEVEPLNLNGFAQAEVVASRVKGLDIQKMYASDFLRAQQTAEPIALSKNIIPDIAPIFGEVMEPSSLFGISEADERVCLHRSNRNGNVENPNWRQEDGENFEDIFTRVQHAKSLLEKDESDSILVVSHSFFMMCFASAILLDAQVSTNAWHDVASKLKISNTGVTLFEYGEERGWRLIMWNDHAHFAE